MITPLNCAKTTLTFVVESWISTGLWRGKSESGLRAIFLQNYRQMIQIPYLLFSLSLKSYIPFATCQNDIKWKCDIGMKWTICTFTNVESQWFSLLSDSRLQSIITLQCDILAIVRLFDPANVTLWTCQCDFSALRLFPASGTLPRELKEI